MTSQLPLKNQYNIFRKDISKIRQAAEKCDLAKMEELKKDQYDFIDVYKHAFLSQGEQVSVLHILADNGCNAQITQLLDSGIKADMPKRIVGYKFDDNHYYGKPEEDTFEIIWATKLERNKIIDDPGNKTPLHFAVSSGHISTAKLLLSRDADINFKTKLKETPLSIAAINGDKDMVSFLLNSEADRFIKNNNMRNPLKAAEHKLDELREEAAITHVLLDPEIEQSYLDTIGVIKNFHDEL